MDDCEGRLPDKAVRGRGGGNGGGKIVRTANLAAQDARRINICRGKVRAVGRGDTLCARVHRGYKERMMGGYRQGQGHAMAVEAIASVDLVAQDSRWGIFNWSWPSGPISNKQQQLIMINDEYYLLIIFDNY